MSEQSTIKQIAELQRQLTYEYSRMASGPLTTQRVRANRKRRRTLQNRVRKLQQHVHTPR